MREKEKKKRKKTARNKLVEAIFLDVARVFVTNGFCEFWKVPSSRWFRLYCAWRARSLLINRVSSTVRYIHYLAPAAHLFRQPIYLFLAAPCVLAFSRGERGINQRFLKTHGRPDGGNGNDGAHFIPLKPRRREITTTAICHPTRLTLSLSYVSLASSRSRDGRI